MTTAYCTRTDVERIFGSANVQRWASLDNNEDADTVDDRIEHACEFATEYVNSRLMFGRYVIPFASVPTLIVHLTAMFAGVQLYDGRRVINDEEPRDGVSRQRKDFDRYIRQIQKGQLKLLDPTTETALEVQDRNVPATVSERTDDEDDEEEWEQAIL